jgi:thiol:disulfide interchange protein DsbC
MKKALIALGAAVAVAAAGSAVLATGAGKQEAPAAAKKSADAQAAEGKAGEARAGEAKGAQDRGAADVRKALEARFPGATITHVAKTKYLGLYEVMLDGQLVYSDPKASFVFVGNIFDAEKKVNVTQERMQELTAVSWSDLPLDLAIKTVRGNGARKLAVFSDVDCPFCKKLEGELKDVDNVTIYTFLFPIDSLHPDARAKSKLVWCASDRQKAYDEIMREGIAPTSSAACDDPVARIAALGEKFRIQATPTLIFADGRVVPGALPKAQLEAQLSRAETAAKTKGN